MYEAKLWRKASKWETQNLDLELHLGMMETRMTRQERERGDFTAIDKVLFPKLSGENMGVHFIIFL